MIQVVAAALGILYCVHGGVPTEEIGARYGDALLAAASDPYAGSAGIALAAYYAVEYPRTPASVAHACARSAVREWFAANPPRAGDVLAPAEGQDTQPEPNLDPEPERESDPEPEPEPEPEAEPQPEPTCEERLDISGARTNPRTEVCGSPGADSVLGCTHGRVNRGTLYACVPPATGHAAWHT